MRKGAFTLVEIMIVVLIIGILMAIAVPNFVKARESSRKNSCIANLKQTDSAKEQWAMDNKKDAGATVAYTDLVGATSYMKSTPTCPSVEPILLQLLVRTQLAISHSTSCLNQRLVSKNFRHPHEKVRVFFCGLTSYRF